MHCTYTRNQIKRPITFFENDNTEPRRNLALEQYLFEDGPTEYLHIWRNDLSLVLGKHQNALKEVFYSFLLDNDLPLLRRISGGGTVFHGPGNINFTLVINRPQDKMVDFKTVLQPVMTALHNMGIPATFSDRHDLLLNGKKISGNAQHVQKGRVLHHGTLLFSADLNLLKGSLRKDQSEYMDKAVKSRPSVVTNISEHFDRWTEVSFFDEFVAEMKKTCAVDANKSWQDIDGDRIDQLIAERYSINDWNIYRSPAYQLHRKVEIEGQSFELKMSVKRGGIIEQLKINENEFDTPIKFSELPNELAKQESLRLSESGLDKLFQALH